MAQWRIWIDTGGTFTDCLALSPEGRRVQVKVLSSSALRATAAEIEVEPAAAGGQPVRDAFVLRYEDSWGLPVGFANDADLHWLGRGEGEGGRVVASKPGELTVRGSAPTASRGRAFEMRFDEESPVLAARLATGAASVSELPPLELRLATTKGTNALLERNGAENALLVTRGFADLLWIGDQRRPDIFARHIERPEPLASHVVEIDARLDARGEVIEELDLEALGPTLVEVASTYQSVGIAFLHSHRHGGHEEAVAARLRELGVPFLSIGASLSPTEGYLARMRTAAVDAYLQPVIRRYLDRIGNAVGGRRLRVMTSAGGLVSAERYRAKDSLLSGPAGGVVGAATAARRLGFERIVAFDMGGTSTDVSRFDGDYEYRFEHRVGDAEVAAPSLAIETVAAGGGSICRIEGQQLKVGPQSAGAHPGPACYGAGGPLTLTDVNLLLGRLDVERFGVPLDLDAAEAAIADQVKALRRAGSTLTRNDVLLGYLVIADQRMAEAVRQISVRRGYDPRSYALVAFGGAGGQHACSVAEQLGIATVILPPEAGLLSAFGLGSAVLERFATRQVLKPLVDVEASIERWLSALGEEARRALSEEAPEGVELETRRRLVFLRLRGQESALEIEALHGLDLKVAFLEAYGSRYGYRPRDPEIEVVSLRAVVSERRREDAPVESGGGQPAAPLTRRDVVFESGTAAAAVHGLEALEHGDGFDGPALVFDSHASLTVPPGWRAEVRGGAIVAERRP